MSEPERFLKLPEVLDRIGVRKTKLYQMIREGGFPAPVKIGSTSVWPNSAVSGWQKEVMSVNGAFE